MTDVNPDEIIEILRDSPRPSGQHGFRYGRDKYGLEQAEKLSDVAAEVASERRDEVAAEAAEQLGALTSSIEESAEAIREAGGISDEPAYIQAGEHEDFINRAILGTNWASAKVAADNAPRPSMAEQKRQAFEQAFNGVLNGNTEPPVEEYLPDEPTPEERAEMESYLADDEDDQVVGYDALGRTVFKDASTGEQYVITE